MTGLCIIHAVMLYVGLLTEYRCIKSRRVCVYVYVVSGVRLCLTYT